MLIDGVIVLAIIFVFVAIYIISVRSALKSYEEYCIQGHFRSEKKILSDTAQKAFPILGLAPTVGLVLFFVVVPLVFSACVAFTNYAAPNHIPPNNVVDWVGFANFTDMFGGNAAWSTGFARVAIWTLAWGAFATFTCYFGGMIMAVILQQSNLKVAPVFRTIFILPYAVPAVVSMLVWNNLLNGSFGIVNRTLIELGLTTTAIPWLSNEWLAKFICVLINLWAGFPYFMLLIMGSMTAISTDIYEAAKIDGANEFQIFKAYTALGTANFFAKPFKNQVAGIATSCVVVGLLRLVCSFFSGILIWGGYAPEGTPVWVYSLTYNSSYMIPEIIVTTMVAVVVARFVLPRLPKVA